MGRKKKGKSTLTRVRSSDLPKLRVKARQSKLSLPDYLSMIARKKIKKRRYNKKWKQYIKLRQQN